MLKTLNIEFAKSKKKRVRIGDDGKNEYNGRAELDDRGEVGDGEIDCNEVGDNEVTEKKNH